MKLTIDLELDTATYDEEVGGWMSYVFDPAIAEGINATAFMAKDALMAATGEQLDRPTDFTRRGFGVYPIDPRDPRDADGVAEINVLPVQARYLDVHIDGGVRKAGDYGSSRDGIPVPGPHAPRDQWGGLPQDYIMRTVKEPGVFWQNLNDNDMPSLCRRMPDGSLQILVVMVKRQEFAPRFDFYGIVEDVGAQHLAANVSAALERAGRLTRDED